MLFANPDPVLEVPPPKKKPLQTETSFSPPLVTAQAATPMVQPSFPDLPPRARRLPPDELSSQALGPAAQVVPLGNGWQPSATDATPRKKPSIVSSGETVAPQLVVVGISAEVSSDSMPQPLKVARSPDRSESTTPPTQPVAAATPVVQTTLDAQQPPVKRQPTGEVFHVALPQVVVPVLIPQASLADPRPVVKRSNSEISQAPTQPVAPLPILPQGLHPDGASLPRRAQQVDVASAPTQPTAPLPVLPQLAQLESTPGRRRPPQEDVSQAPVQPVAALPVQPQASQPDAPTVPRRAQQVEPVLPPLQPAPVLITVQTSSTEALPILPKRARAIEDASPPRELTGFVPVFQPQPADPPKMQRRQQQAETSQAPTQPAPPLPFEPQSAVHDTPLKPRPTARAEVSLAPFQPPPPPPAPTFFGSIGELPNRVRRVLDTFIQSLIDIIQPSPPTAHPSIFISGIRDSISISGVFGMPEVNAPISMPIGSRRVIRWTYRAEPTDAQAALGQPGDRIPLVGVQEIILTATRFHGPAATPADLLVQKKLSRSEIVIVNPGATLPTDPNAGDADITVMPMDTRGKEAGQFWYDVKVEFSSDDTDDDFPTDSTFTLTDHSGR